MGLGGYVSTKSAKRGKRILWRLTMPKFSIIYLTYRPGGYDMLADGLAHQTCQDYELICVDERVDLHQARWQYLLEHNVKVTAISQSKKKCFADTAFNLINAYNTGVLLSRGDCVVIMNDFTWLPPDALARFLKQEKMLQEDTVISASADYSLTEFPRKKDYMNDPITVWEKPWSGNPEANGYSHGEVWIGDPMELFYTCFPYSLLVKMNGFPECYDNHKANQVVPTFEGIQRAGGKVFNDRENQCFMIHHREWGGGLWYQSKKETKGSTTLNIRENTFGLKTHQRGTLPMGVGNENLEVYDGGVVK
jgi:hypothetical protein